MKITIPQNIIHLLLFFLAVIFSYSNNYEMQFAVWVSIAGYYILGKYSKSFLLFIACYVLICVLGLFRGFLYDYSFFYIARDFSYFLKPVLGLVIGYQVFKSTNLDFLKVIVYISLVIAICHLSILLYHLVFTHLGSIERIRYVGGYFSDFEVYGIIILVFSNKLGLNIKKQTKYILLLIIGTSAILYFARTNVIQFVILGLGMLGFFKFNLRNGIILCCLIFIGLIGYNKIVELNPRRGADGIENFLYKIKNAPYEIYDPYVKNDDSPRFHDRFRSYETKITILQVLNKNDASIWLGSGFGSLVDYGRVIHTTENTQVRYAPILHNGYTTVFLKVGIIGLGIFIFSLLYLCFYGKESENKQLNTFRTFINSTGVFMFLSTLVFLGFYLKLDNKTLVLGALIAYYERLKYKQQKNLISK